jgi:hypothetical protein
MLWFKGFDAAQSTLTSIKLVYMLGKQLQGMREASLSMAEQFCTLAV